MREYCGCQQIIVIACVGRTPDRLFLPGIRQFSASSEVASLDVVFDLRPDVRGVVN
jgi:hypothetical protein